jgi:hypothetical protein
MTGDQASGSDGHQVCAPANNAGFLHTISFCIEPYSQHPEGDSGYIHIVKKLKNLNWNGKLWSIGFQRQSGLWQIPE